MQKVRVFRCPGCSKVFNSLKTWANHVEQKHPELIPENWTPARYFYYLQTGKSTGKCVMCHNATEWNEGTCKYNRFCGNPKCKEAYRNQFKSRMIGKYGKVTLLDDPDHQRKMIMGRRNSGYYDFPDGKIGYSSSYELDFLKMCDKFLHMMAQDIIQPSPHSYYYDYVNPEDKENEGRKFYIPDFFIPSLNLEIEIKQNTSTHPKIIRVDKVKESEKDSMMATVKGINYIKIVDKDYTEFFNLISELRNSIPESDLPKKPIEVPVDPDISTESTVEEYLEFTESLEALFSPIRDLMKGYPDDSDTALEAAGYAPGRTNPVFVLLSMGNSILARIIKKATKDSISHSCISFSSSLDPLYSFGTNKITDNGKLNMGFIITNPYSELWTSRSSERTPYELYVTFVSDDDLQKMKARLQYFIDNQDKLKYSFAGLVRIFFNIKSPKKRKWFCSAFVAEILGAGNVQLAKDSTLYRPSQLASINNIEFVLAGDDITKYNPKETEKKLKTMMNVEVATEVTTETGPYAYADAPDKLLAWMKQNIKYSNFTKLLSPKETLAKRAGSCHDQMYLIYSILKGHQPGLSKWFFIENDGKSGGTTHSFVTYTKGNKIVWIETAWGGHQGLMEFVSAAELKTYIKAEHDKKAWGDASKYPNIQFGHLGNLHPGMSLAEIVEAGTSKTPATEALFQKGDDGYVSKGYLSLNSLKVSTMTKNSHPDIPELKHVRFCDRCEGELFYQDNEVVCYYMTRPDLTGDGWWITALEILPKFRGQKLSSQLLKRITDKYKPIKLSVNKKNTLAYQIYLKYGFKEFKNKKATSSQMIFMRYK